MFFAVFGVILFGVIYTTSISGESLDIFRSPRIIGAILIPFLPAAIMSILAQRAEKKWLLSRHNIDENES